MTSQVNLEDIYTELNDLLKDVCSFLTTEAHNGTLSAKAKNEAEKLVSRSRKQVDIVTKLSELQESANSNYPYLQMQGPGATEEVLSEYVPAEITDYYELEDHYEESYAPVDDEVISSPPSSSTINEDYCCYSDITMCMIEERSVKYGPLYRKERYIMFIEQKKQYMAALMGYWLLIYGMNKRDQKPIQSINLLNYSARSIEQQKDPIFEIYAENEKSYEFIARSAKDMEQWIVAINCKKHMSTNGRDLPEIPQNINTSEFTDNSDRNSNKINSDNQNLLHYELEEDVYASVEDFGKLEVPKTLTTITTDFFPVLPPRSKEPLSPPKKSSSDNTYNNLQKTETEMDDNTDREYDLVQALDTQKHKKNKEIETDNKMQLTETVNKNVRKPLFSNTANDNYDSVDTGEEELEDYDTIKSITLKTPTKIDSSLENNIEDEEMVDYDEVKIITHKHKATGNKFDTREELLENYDTANSTTRKISTKTTERSSNNCVQEEEEEMVDYDEVKLICPIQNKTIDKFNTEEELLENCDTAKILRSKIPIKSTSEDVEEDEEMVDYDEVKSISHNQNKPTYNYPKKTDSVSKEKGLENNEEIKLTNLMRKSDANIEEEEMVDYDEVKSISHKQNKPTYNYPKKTDTAPKEKVVESNDEIKPSKPTKKFWERKSESPKKEAYSDNIGLKRSMSNQKMKGSLQMPLNSPDKNKPPITSPKPKSQMLLNNSKVQNIRQHLENTLSFRSHKN